MSAPAMNDFSPAPVSTTTRTLSSCFIWRATRLSSSSVGAFNAFNTFGRFTVTIATAPLCSRRRLSKDIARNLERKRPHQPAEHDRRRDEAREQHPAKPQLLPRIVLGERGEDERHEKRKDDEQEEVAVRHVHYLRPIATSHASITTS